MRTMKDSGIKWIGQIPESWGVWRMKHLAKSPLQYGANATGIEFDPDLPRYIRITDITPDRKLSNDGKQSLPENIAKDFLLENGDLLFARSGATSGKSFFYNDSYGKCCFAGYLIRFRADGRKANSRFLYYYTLTRAYEYWTQEIFIQATIQNISAEKYDNLVFAIPSSLDEQKRIVEYLDSKCSEIDTLIAAKEKTNALLRERRQSIIYEAVTKGLDPSAPMKDSGVEWIGKIPTTWNTIRAKHVAAISNGSDPRTEGDTPVYGSGSESFRTCGEFKEGPAVLIGRKGATLHIPHYVEGKYWNVDTAFDVKTNEAVFLLKYYYYAAICFDYKLYISTTTLPSMTQTNYGNMYLPFPVVEEQKQIVNHIEKTILQIDQLITNYKASIQKLKEYRQSLIFEAVTGKIEV